MSIEANIEDSFVPLFIQIMYYLIFKKISMLQQYYRIHTQKVSGWGGHWRWNCFVTTTSWKCEAPSHIPNVWDIRVEPWQIGLSTKARNYQAKKNFNLYYSSIHAKRWTGWITSWNQDCQDKYQQPQMCRWYHSNGGKWRGTKEPLDEG